MIVGREGMILSLGVSRGCLCNEKLNEKDNGRVFTRTTLEAMPLRNVEELTIEVFLIESWNVCRSSVCSMEHNS